MKNLFPECGKWFRGNLHMHTTCSDGKLSQKQALQIYREAGYDFVAMTDHWVQNRNITSANGMLVMDGIELDNGGHNPIYHILGVGMEREISLDRSAKLEPQQMINAVREAGGLAILAHPMWSVTDPQDVMNLAGLCGTEIYNTVSGLPWNGDRADSSAYIDIWALKGKMMRCLAGDDSHFYNGEQTRSYIMVKANECTLPALKKALLAGDFYASQGPRFHAIRVGGGRVEVECSGAKTVVFNSNTVWCDDRVQPAVRGITAYTVKPTDTYVRVVLLDAEGRKAWSSPFVVGAGRSEE